MQKLKIQAAIMDPETGKIYTGYTHSDIIDDMEDKNKAVFLRIRVVYTQEGKFPTAKHVGFTDGKILLNRAESQLKWGVYNSNDLRWLK